MTDIESLAHSIAHRPCIYLACPYTIGDQEQNVTNAIEMAQVLDDMGFTCFNPLLNHFAHKQIARHYEEWMQDDVRWLSKCDAVYRMPGPSKGADREELVAGLLNVPVFYDIDLLRLHFGKRGEWVQKKHLPPDGLDDATGDVNWASHVTGRVSVRKPRGV